MRLCKKTLRLAHSSCSDTLAGSVPARCTVLWCCAVKLRLFMDCGKSHSYLPVNLPDGFQTLVHRAVVPITHIYSLAYHYHTLFRPAWAEPPVDEEPPAATLRGGTLFTGDFIALIPTLPLWGTRANPPPHAVAGPRYEDLPESNNAPSVKFAVQLSVYHPLAPCHQRRQGELVKTWCPNLRVLCTFTIAAHLQLLT
jgi:hypothetical protein